MKMFLAFALLASFSAQASMVFKHKTCEVVGGEIGGTALTEVESQNLVKKLKKNGFVFPQYASNEVEDKLLLDAALITYDEAPLIVPNFGVRVGARNAENPEQYFTTDLYQFFRSILLFPNYSKSKAKYFLFANLPTCKKI